MIIHWDVFEIHRSFKNLINYIFAVLLIFEFNDIFLLFIKISYQIYCQYY